MKAVRWFYFKIPRFLRTLRAAIIYVILIVLYFVLTNGAADQSKIDTATVMLDNVSSEIIASGRITSELESTLHFAVSGRVATVLVKEGEDVVKGQVIATLDREKYQISLREAEWTFQAAKAEFDKVYDSAAGRSSETFDERVERTAVDKLHNNAYEGLLRAQRNLRDTVLTSPIDGTITSLSIKPGEEIQVTSSIAEVSDLSSLQFTANIDETEIADLREGQKAIVVLDAYPDDQINSTVLAVALRSTETTTGATAYQVDFSFPQNSGYRLGMNGEVTIVTDTEEDTLTIPLESLVDDDFVLVKVENGYEKRKVKLGLMSDISVQVLSGLANGDRVVTGGFDEISKRSLLDLLLGRS